MLPLASAQQTNRTDVAMHGQHLRYIDTRIFGIQHLLLYGTTRDNRVQPTCQIDTILQYIILEREEGLASSS